MTFCEAWRNNQTHVNNPSIAKDCADNVIVLEKETKTK